MNLKLPTFVWISELNRTIFDLIFLYRLQKVSCLLYNLYVLVHYLVSSKLFFHVPVLNSRAVRFHKPPALIFIPILFCLNLLLHFFFLFLWEIPYLSKLTRMFHLLTCDSVLEQLLHKKKLNWTYSTFLQMYMYISIVPYFVFFIDLWILSTLHIFLFTIYIIK